MGRLYESLPSVRIRFRVIETNENTTKKTTQLYCNVKIRRSTISTSIRQPMLIKTLEIIIIVELIPRISDAPLKNRQITPKCINPTTVPIKIIEIIVSEKNRDPTKSPQLPGIKYRALLTKIALTPSAGNAGSRRVLEFPMIRNNFRPPTRIGSLFTN